MAEFSNLTKRRFGQPPALDETPGNLAAPEVAPSVPEVRSAASKTVRKSREKTGRTVLFSTRVSEEFDRDFRATAKQDNLLLTRLLELALEAYCKQRNV